MLNRLAAMAGADVRIGISRRSLTIARCGAFGKRASLIHNEQFGADAPLESTLARCRATLAQASCAGLPLAITLGDDLARLFLVTPPQNAARVQDLAGAASMRFHSLFGETPRDWRIEADWRARSDFLACALPRAMVEQCAEMARDLHMPLTAMQPHFVNAWNLARAELGGKGDVAWLAVLRGTHLSLGIPGPDAKRLFAIRGVTLPTEKAALDWLQEQVTRTSLQAGLGSPSRLLLAGDHNADWTGGKHAKLRVVRFDKETMPGILRLAPQSPQSQPKGQ